MVASKSEVRLAFQHSRDHAFKMPSIYSFETFAVAMPAAPMTVPARDSIQGNPMSQLYLSCRASQLVIDIVKKKLSSTAMLFCICVDIGRPASRAALPSSTGSQKPKVRAATANTEAMTSGSTEGSTRAVSIPASAQHGQARRAESVAMAAGVK